MKYLVRITVIVFALLLSPHKTESYVRSPASNSTGTPIAWNLTNPDNTIVSNGRITWSLNSAGSDNLPFAQVEQAITTSFQTWEDLPTSLVAFARGPNTTSTATNSDGLLQIFWQENSTTTGDGLNLSGALAISRLTTYVSGPRTGEIIDAALVFNGNQFTWATDGRADAVDVQEVATHEIGHIIGLSHSPIGGATMYPRSGPGRIESRTLSADDRIAASLAYPAAGFLSSTGTIRGVVRDNNGALIFGAHVVAVDSNGIATASNLSQPDGTYSIQGLPAGNYIVYAEPLDSISGAYFSRFDLQNFYSNTVTDFQTSNDTNVSVGAGGTATLDIGVTRGNPALDGYYVSDNSGSAFYNVPTTVRQGQSNVVVGVAGPGLPQSGSPLSISGPGITILRTSFTTTTSGLPIVLVNVNVGSTAPPGPRNIIINNGSQRTIVTGGVEVLGTAAPTVATVSAANFANQVAAESIASAFGTNLASSTVSANTNPLPTSLAGTTVRLRDAVGNERLAPLFFVSPGQINYQIAPGITIGQTSITVTNGGTIIAGNIQVDAVAPGIFTADATGKGLAAAVALRVKPNGTQSFEQVIRFDQAQNKFVAIPIDLSITADQVFLVLFGTGIRFRSALPSVTVGGAGQQVTYAGSQGALVGLDQVNVRLDQSLKGRGSVTVTVTVDGRPANSTSVAIL